MQNLTERLRPLVGLNGWDYCVYWKLTEDQRYVEWLGCCCGGTENNENGGEEDHHLFPVASCCRDTMFPHPRTKPCDLLSHLPNSIPTDSGIHAQALLTNQPNWVNYSNTLDPNTLEETIGTQVLIPVPGGLVELFVTNKQVPEDNQVIDFVTTQCIALMEQEAGVNHSVSFTNNIDVNSICNHNTMQQSNPLLGDENEGNNNNNDMPISLCSSPLNFMQQFSYNNSLKHTTELEEQQQQCIMMNHETVQDLHDTQFVEPMLDTKQDHDDQKQLGHVAAGRSDSISDCSDQNEELEDEDGGKYGGGGGRRRNGKGNQSKNLVAERKRRKKLNDRLYNLRSLVPRISKLDRASILGDAIEFVKDLQKQVKELQDELEENNSDTAAAADSNNNNMNQFVQNDINGGEGGKAQYGFHVGNGYVPKQKQEVDAATAIDNKHTQQMEAQVEVALIDGNEYFVKVFCEHRPGGFVKLMEALNTLGMDVVHATVTSHKGLVSNVFKVEKKDSEMVEAEDVRDSLLELTRNNPSSCRGWTTTEMTSATISSSENNNNGAVGRDHHHQNHLHNHQMEMGAYHPHPFHTT